MLKREFRLLQAVSLNMGMMVGVGPFITIPLFVATMGGPQAMIGWVLGALVAIADGLVWSELAAAFSGSGGPITFTTNLRPAGLGRLLKFLFVWQFLFSAPLELATGAIGLASTPLPLTSLETPAWSVTIPSAGVWSVTWGQILGMGAMAAIVGLAYRRIEVAGRLLVILWAGMIVTVAWVIVAGLTRFDPRTGVRLPARRLAPRRPIRDGARPGARDLDVRPVRLLSGLLPRRRGGRPGADDPALHLISVVAVSSIYLVMNLGILGVLPAPR
jgi:amino acid transporter